MEQTSNLRYTYNKLQRYAGKRPDFLFVFIVNTQSLHSSAHHLQYFGVRFWYFNNSSNTHSAAAQDATVLHVCLRQRMFGQGGSICQSGQLLPLSHSAILMIRHDTAVPGFVAT